MHGLGHGIGLAVHDPDQKDRDGIAVGSAYSIEPGIYVRQELLDIIPKAGNEAMLAKIGPAVRKYANTGVRIEDNYVVTESGVKWVSCIAREADEVEARAGQGSGRAGRRKGAVVRRHRGGRQGSKA
jgi:Xaa-Pro aminopeptidase